MRAQPQVVITGSRLFSRWLADARASLAFTTYQAGKVLFIGLQPDGTLSVFERSFDRCMGLAARERTLWMATRTQMWRFEDFLEPGTQKDGYDARFVPVAGHTTGDVDVHDVHLRADKPPLFIVTRFNAIATLAQRGSFEVVWMPPFIDRVVAEDRCHLNGMAVEDDQPRFVTCVGRSNVSDGWRDHRVGGGLVIDVATGETACAGLSMPHSPRLHNGALWLVQSGTGEFGRVDLKTGRFEPVCFIPGFARGLTFVGEYAVIGMSRPRENRTFTGLPLDERLAREGAQPKCGLAVVNLETGALEHQLIIEGVVQELYDVAVLPRIIRPMALGFRNDEIAYSIRPEIAPDVADRLGRR